MNDPFTLGKLNQIAERQAILLRGQQDIKDQLNALEGMLVKLLNHSEPTRTIIQSEQLPSGSHGIILSGAPAQRAHGQAILDRKELLKGGKK